MTFRFENIGQEVRISGLTTRPDDNVEIQFKNVSGGVFLSGTVSRPEGGHHEEADSKSKASVSVKIVGTSNATLEALVVDAANVDFRLEMTSGNKFSISDSFFSQLPKSSVEIFGVGLVEIFHSEFLNVSSGSVVVDADVKTVNVVDSILENDVVVRRAHDGLNILHKFYVRYGYLLSFLRQLIEWRIPNYVNHAIGDCGPVATF